MVLSALMVTAYPFYPYGDKGEQRNAFVNDDSVAANFKNDRKFETEDVKPAMVMEYLMNLMDVSKAQSKQLLLPG